MTGTLFVVATPIGNLKDVTLRALETLRETDLIACEDTRQTKKLLAHHSISKPLVSYFAHNEARRAPELLERLRHGAKVALVTDAGTPGLSDPGWRLVGLARRAGIRVVAIPGPSALASALSISGIPGDEFFFAGFLPRAPSRLAQRVRELKSLATTVVLFVPPHRLRNTLEAIAEVWGAETPVILCRELTKLFEEVAQGNARELLEHPSVRRARGEYVMLIPKSHHLPTRGKISYRT